MKYLDAMRSKAETLAWFLKRPQFYPELGRRVLNWKVTTEATTRARREGRRKGVEWCSARETDLSEVLAAVGLTDTSPDALDRYRRELQAARDRVQDVPVLMGGEGHVELIFRLVLGHRLEAAVETGVAYGWSSLACLTAMRELGTGRLVSIDMPYPKRGNEPWVGVAVPEPLRDRWILLRLPDRDGLPKALGLLDHRIDFFHYDSDKTAEGRTFGYGRAWRALRSGGFLMSDDVEDNLAFRDFAEATGAPFWIIKKTKPENYAGLIRKP